MRIECPSAVWTERYTRSTFLVILPSFFTQNVLGTVVNFPKRP